MKTEKLTLSRDHLGMSAEKSAEMGSGDPDSGGSNFDFDEYEKKKGWDV